MKRSTKPKAWSDAEKRLLSKLARAEENRCKIRRISDVKELFHQMRDHA
jgi:hypothetical protein